MRPPASPEATTSAILGASSIGWSPQRQSRRIMQEPSGDATPSDLGSEQGSPSASARIVAVPEHRANLASLRSHGLVSNSIFKHESGNFSPASSQATSNAGSPVSPSRLRSPPQNSSPQQQHRLAQELLRGVGLGIKPFASHAPINRDNERPTTPTCARGVQETSTPNSTPRAAESRNVSTPVDLNRSLLVSNRLTGPRQMDISLSTMTDSTLDTASKRLERRKTVTFDENLDVQEFDRESSFDRDSLQSASSQASSLTGSQFEERQRREDADAMWLCREGDDSARKVVERLMVVNGSPESESSAFRMPELGDQAPLQRSDHSVKAAKYEQHQAYDDVSNDSRELSSIDEPHSPSEVDARDRSAPQANAEFGRRGLQDNAHIVEYAESGDLSGGNLSAYGALHRVESMVDELLGDELLDGHCGKRAKVYDQRGHNAQLRSPEATDATDSPPRRRRRMAAKPVAELQLTPPQAADLTLSLPAWSPLIDGDIRTPAVPPAASSTPQTLPLPAAKAGGRPHISREAVLEKVAREREVRGMNDRAFGSATSPIVLNQQEQSKSPPAGLTPAQQAQQIIARRRSKNGLPDFSPTEAAASVEEGDLGEGDTSELQEFLLDGDSTSQTGERHVLENDKAVNLDVDKRQSRLLDVTNLLDNAGNTFETGLQREISRIYHQGDLKYRVQDRGVFRSAEKESDAELRTNLQRSAADGPNASGSEQSKAWRKLRRPSDMNEYAKEVRDYRSKENPKRMAGKVFVLVDSFTPTILPVPQQNTRFFCVLDNGLHVVRTATSGLRTGGAPSNIGQEFELIQHKNLSFSLTLVAQRDAHLKEPQENVSPASKRDRITPSFSRGVGKLFSSPKKRGNHFNAQSNSSLASNLSPTGGSAQEPMLKFMNREGAFGQANVVFERVAADCLSKCLVLDLAVYGVSDPPSSTANALNSPDMDVVGAPACLPRLPSLAQDFSDNLGKKRGMLRLKLFYLPPLPGIPKTLLPENLNDCIKGMEAARWHTSAHCWIEGTLTQLGGDCQSWRRRPMKVQGVHLIGFNEITKRATVKIDLSKAISIEENKDPVKNTLSSYDDEEIDETYHVERSFRITFQDGEKIFFFADSDEEMHDWLEGLSKVVGNASIPPQCPWAQVALEATKNESCKAISEEPSKGLRGRQMNVERSPGKIV